MLQQQRWCYYRIFVKWRRRSQAQFIGRRLDYEQYLSLYQDQDGLLYLVFTPEEFSVRGRYPDYVRINCFSYHMAKTRKEFADQYRRLGRPVPTIVDVPVPIEDMHTMTEWDS